MIRRPLRYSWHVIADPPRSWTARILRFAIPVWAAAGLASLLLTLALDMPWSWSLPRLADAVWLFIVLGVVRQRDAARAAVGVSPHVQASGHAGNRDHPPRARTAPPAPHPEITPDHRNEAP